MGSIRCSATNRPRMTVGASLLALLVFAPLSFAQDTRFAYVAELSSNAISQHQINSSTGALTFRSAFPVDAPSSIAVTPSERFLFVTSYVSDGKVAGFAMDPTTGALTPVPGSPFVAGKSPYRVTIAPSGRFVYTANYGSNDVSAFSINPISGTLTAVPGSPFATGTHPYKVALSPSGAFAYVANSVSRNITAFRVDAGTGALSPVAGSPFVVPGASQDGSGVGLGAGPHAVAVGPNGQYLYVANAYSYTVGVYAIDPTSGSLTAIAGSPFAAAQAPWDLAVSASGQHLYVANGGAYPGRTNGSVSVFTIDAFSGAIVPVTNAPFTSGPATRGITLAGDFAYAPSYYGNSISAFTVASGSGALVRVAGSPFATGSNPVEVAVTLGMSCTGAVGSGLSLASASPTHGGNAGLVTISVRGCGMFGTPTLRLRREGQADIVGREPTLSSGGLVSATFDLRSQSVGEWDVVVDNPDGAGATLARGFDVRTGGGPAVWVDTVGLSRIRIGGAQVYYVVVGNNGDVDAGAGTAWMSFPPGVNWRVDPKTIVSAKPHGDGGPALLSFYIPVLAPRTSIAIPVTLEIPLSAVAPFGLRVWVNRP
jgi:6-phosphogluconolactonase